MRSYIAVMLNPETSEPVTTFEFQAESETQACVIAAAYADENGYELGDIVYGSK